MQGGDGLLGVNPKEATGKTAAEEGKQEEPQKEKQAQQTSGGDGNQNPDSKKDEKETEQVK